MAFLDARPPLNFRLVNGLLLKAAKNPSEFADYIYALTVSATAPGTDSRTHPANMDNFILLTRQASAAVVVNCTCELWSVLVHCLLVLEPSNQLTDDIKAFVDEERFATLRFFEHFYKVANAQFSGTTTQQDLKIIHDLRNLLVHDKPDEANVDITKQTVKLITALRSRIPENELCWLPPIPATCAPNNPLPADPRIVIMNFMRYPLAKWVVEATERITTEMRGLVTKFPGKRRLVNQAIAQAIPLEHLNAPLEQRMHVAGISIPITPLPATPETSCG